MVHFVGAGCGAVDLITVRGQKFLGEADVVIYAGSLIDPELLRLTPPGCELHNSAHMTLTQIISVIEAAEAAGKTTVRLQTGDLSLYSALREQTDALDRLGIAYDVCPGVSAFCGAAAALKTEYTPPEISQTVILTRMEGRTPVPEPERIEALAAHRATMVIFLSAGMLKSLSERLQAGGYPPDTPAAVVYKVSWADEQVHRCTVSTLAETAAAHGITKTALITVGKFLGDAAAVSKLYDAHFTTGYREGIE